jgi:uncharacterized protein YeaO (DUF488 family)
MPIVIKRVYNEPEPTDGFRVLVDRLWPRGLTRDAARIDLWLKDAAPSTKLRAWFGHEPAKFGEFAELYRAELRESDPGVFLPIVTRVREGSALTLLFAARDEQHNHAAVLADWVRERA